MTAKARSNLRLRTGKPHIWKQDGQWAWLNAPAWAQTRHEAERRNFAAWAFCITAANGTR